MNIFNPTALADATARAGTRRGWGNTVAGIGVTALVIAAFTGWNMTIVIIGCVAVILGVGLMYSAEKYLHNAIAEAAADAAFGFDVQFDPTWIPVIRQLYRDARAEATRSHSPLDETFDTVFQSYLVERGYATRF